MNIVHNYKRILEDVFQKSVDLKISKITNNCIGAIASKEFSVFTQNFLDRLVRLKDYYSQDANAIASIINTAKAIGEVEGYKWAGAYSELVALDYWTSFRDIPSVKYIVKEDTENFHDSVARSIGQKTIDLDLEIELAIKTIYTDVKCFIPLHQELTDLLMSRVSDKVNIGKFLIGVDSVYEIDYLRLKADLQSEIKGNLGSMLQKAIEERKTNFSYKLKSGASINFSMAYPKSGRNNIILQTLREVDPYMLARDYRYKILDYYSKFIFSEPSLITWVVNPWFNAEMNGGPDEFRKTFLRSLARRIFMELSKDTTMMSQYFPTFMEKNDMSVSEISKLISGVVFIFDNSVLGNLDNLYDSYIYLNPHATNKQLIASDFNLLSWSKSKYRPLIDDFQNDCY
jgi:hypothetical protein